MSRSLYRVEVAARDPGQDAAGRAVFHDLQDLGLREITQVRAIQVYTLAGDLGCQDADRIAQHGVKAVQINTGGACHLDARMVHKHLDAIALDQLDVLIIENVGNLVCPAEFDLGEHDKVMVLSVTEGHDKPLKYPLMFTESGALILNKIDLLPHTDFDMEELRKTVTAMNPGIQIFPLSAKTGEGFDQFVGWLEGKVASTGRGPQQ